MLEKDLKISQKERKEILKQLGLPLSLAGIEQKREKAILDFFKNSKDI